MEKLKKIIRDVPDFPKPGIIFKDITPLLKDPQSFRDIIDAFAEQFKNKGIQKIVGIESRGFMFGAALAYQLGIGFIPVRKKGKLPWKTVSQSYDLEYGTDTVEMHADAVETGECVLVVDDLLATGGTAEAVNLLLKKQKAKVFGFAFVVELEFLKGREKLVHHNILSLVKF
ncbi:MAG: adenine phosphoribosyltransferase [Deltaproteobacteria bacterium RIFCSPLOWO2_12_FULL_40_28]|nr:MAG: adenine phosphoribosyltransferase [Deltaproteobacteria bacterium RIFCSPHIGHO2_02_FULL_40_28]OGQ20194.1 MAG: adenine phosphoribosyltransferase [Deltaproteobacteria bacterium RIFCSPHIGHO2_12_FULL_40_32]OGQ40185.1 MAG: adenine phosphoribosyltransferase [Deltaproteobacteria bacterium RIFCSPLOWO2_02_FULL_40_36]OGQ54749.1 MAG: adenine phosphoribosyltransferase [Deltaproteobacteria bacterium RIFCSPLOWO2_12_FULL_40_28]